jgi:hypothetical protein
LSMLPWHLQDSSSSGRSCSKQLRACRKHHRASPAAVQGSMLL